jgi:hypothetical protein
MKISLTTLLTVLFIGLKLTDYIDWSWWWVLSPLWITFVIYIIMSILFMAFAVFVALLPKKISKKNK